MTNPSDAIIRAILTSVRSVAVVGWSPNLDRPSHGVADFLKARGMRMIPVNPGQAGQVYGGERIAASLGDVAKDARVEMVDIFRRSEAVPEIVDEALAALPDLRVIWMQLGVSHPEATAKARAAGVTVIENRCPKIEARRLGLA
ncbi:CoA-binding protein [Frigidibacter sp. RF13]|uniref:CoA-binding protein n=1 Tax=Frigidibacter sp. RF13 TaxID=2997340 RepID=UPI002270B9BB|nr:CoA-binding protein [Frigidibacter sp. RF13]MCY1128526.1 CoA-binding protein [Frigidibacter sp. RF13]